MPRQKISKEQLQYIADHPEDSIQDIARTLKVSSPTVWRWRKMLQTQHTVDELLNKPFVKGKDMTTEEVRYLAENRGKKSVEELANELGRCRDTIKRWFLRLDDAGGDTGKAWANYRAGRATARAKGGKKHAEHKKDLLCTGRCFTCLYFTCMGTAGYKKDGYGHCNYALRTGTSRTSLGVAGLFGDDCPLYEPEPKSGRKKKEGAA